MADFSTDKMIFEPFGSGNTIHYIKDNHYEYVSLLYRDGDGKFQTLKKINDKLVDGISFSNYFSSNSFKVIKLGDDGTVTK